MPAAVASSSSAHSHMSRSTDDEKYYLRFDDDAKLRLSQQNRVTRELMGGRFLSDKVVSHLQAISDSGRRPRICDIGTGPGDWMFDTQTQLRSLDIQPIFHGYDLFPIHFPSKEEQESKDVYFYKLNIHDKSTFPELLAEKYDLVHVRYMSIVIVKQQWEGAFVNCLGLLEPDGVMIWEEILFDEFEMSDRSEYPHAAKIFDMGVAMFIRNGLLLNCSPKLTPLFKNNFQQSTQIKFSTTNLNEDWQRLQAKNMYMVTREMLMKKLEAAGKEGEAAEELGFGSADEAVKTADLSMEDYRKGCLTNMTICQWIGEGFGG
ncbi:hypothetical protein TWF106_009919 [Orbilia oligospora]|uniref:Methyltransferase domain-containing protein n=1 Tax=Orbilia oligospora TaxID=2813651 RepID=A0A6G1LQU5_ORBOL|nr:hypothetical protein TWF679_002851 [Orbilia oligospora]KAF3222185.1 hypothetical protein TWF191_006945 [Orbilia oligospora]KAF3227407.1 hypothetical protein TWF106_009919 [Orbilia oligospora]KAF3231778.1 hypothetical protein TWF192_003399 [Orbilia oligospora]